MARYSRHLPSIGRRLAEKRDDKFSTSKQSSREGAKLKTWLLDRLESEHYCPRDPPALTPLSEIARKAGDDDEFLQDAASHTGDDDVDVHALVEELVLPNAVPFLPTQI